MSLEEMKLYTGMEQPPKNFDSFWDNALAHLFFENSYQLIKKNFSMDYVDCYDLSFEGTNHSMIYAKCLFPKNKHNVPVIFYFHGYQGQSPDWSECFKYVLAGFGVVCMDVRGQSGKSIDSSSYKGNTVKGHILRGTQEGPEHLFYTNIYLDIYQLIEIVSSFEFVNPNILYSYGASQGGALALVAAALNKKISLTVSIYPFLSDFKRVLDLGNHSEAYNELFRYFKFKDPLHKTEEEILGTLAYIDVKNFAHRIKGKVHFITGLEDDVCPPSTQFAIYNRLKTEKDIIILPEYGHEAMNVSINDLTFNWLTHSNIEV